MYVHGQRYENHEHLPPPVGVVAGHVARGQRKTVSWKRGINLTSIGSLQLVEHVYNAFREVAF